MIDKTKFKNELCDVAGVNIKPYLYGELYTDYSKLLEETWKIDADNSIGNAPLILTRCGYEMYIDATCYFDICLADRKYVYGLIKEVCQDDRPIVFSVLIRFFELGLKIAQCVRRDNNGEN